MSFFILFCKYNLILLKLYQFYKLKMKKILFVLLITFLFNCEKKTKEQTNGFGPYEGQSVYLGNQSTVEVFKVLDKAWAARDYTAMMSIIEDGGLFIFEDGHTVSTGQEFVDKVEAEYIESIKKDQEWGWKTNYAFSVYPEGSDDPKATNQNGEWVNAQFSGNDGTYIEWYQIVNGKLKMWYQTKGKYVIPED